MQKAKFSLLINIFKDLQVIIQISFFVGNLVYTKPFLWNL